MFMVLLAKSTCFSSVLTLATSLRVFNMNDVKFVEILNVFRGI